MNPTDFQNIVDHASNANDRWLFIATLLILLGFAAMVIRWLVKRLEQQSVAHSAFIEDQSKRHNDMLEKFGVLMHDCAQVLKDVKKQLEK